MAKRSKPDTYADCKHCSRRISRSWLLRHQKKCIPAVTTLQRAIEPLPPPPAVTDVTGTYIKVPPAVLEALAPVLEKHGPLIAAGFELFKLLRERAK